MVATSYLGRYVSIRRYHKCNVSKLVVQLSLEHFTTNFLIRRRHDDLSIFRTKVVIMARIDNRVVL